MPQNISLSISVDTGAGAAISVSRTVTATATDLVQVEVGAAPPPPPPPGGGGPPPAPPVTTATFDLQPGGAGKVKLLLLQANIYPGLAFRRETATGWITLDGPQLILGSDVVDLLGTPLNRLEVRNSGSQAAIVSIFVARDAI